MMAYLVFRCLVLRLLGVGLCIDDERSWPATSNVFPLDTQVVGVAPYSPRYDGDFLITPDDENWTVECDDAV